MVLMHRGIAGDLYLVLHIEEKQGIQRDGMNLYSKIDVDYTEAILGAIKKVQPFFVQSTFFLRLA